MVTVAVRCLLVLLSSLEAAGRTTELAFAFRKNGGSSTLTTTITHFPTSSSPSTTTVTGRRRRTAALPQLYGMIPFDVDAVAQHTSTFWLAAVEVFDGSDIVDPVVVSNVFWSSLQARIASFVMGQIFAVVAFSILLAVLASGSGKITAFLSDTIFAADKSSNRIDIKIPPEMQQQGAVALQPDWLKLLACILVDTVGASSELVPILGEATDVIWAPIAGLILRQLYGGNNNLLWGLEFAEEILPFTDILPLCTLCWVIDTFFADSKIAQLLQLGLYGSTSSSNNNNQSHDLDAIDVDHSSDDKNIRSRR